MSCWRLVTILLALSVQTYAAIRRDLSGIRYRYTSCNVTGRAGPSPAECTQFYTWTNSPLIRDNVFFTFSSSSLSGAQGFTTPKQGIYNITVAGAAGGRGLCNTLHGRGLTVLYQRNLSQGFQYLVLVGQQGLGPCDVAPEYALCQDPPANATEIDKCEEEWLRTSGDMLNYAGGGGGGGASMLWETQSSGQHFGIFPIVITGGGGGTSRVLDPSIAKDLVTSFNSTTVNCSGITSESCYQMLIDANPQILDSAINVLTGGPGYRSTDVSPIAGVGGGFFPGVGDLDEDGRQLGDITDFASGGFSCLRGSIFTASEFVDVLGGFGGGGGPCVEGGGGGGYTGGDLLSSGKFVPGGGGYSTITGFRDVPDGDFSWNEEEGYVDLVPADCGCVYKCTVFPEDGQFECACPVGTEMAPEESDCYEATDLHITPRDFDIVNSSGLHIRALPFTNETKSSYIYSIQAVLQVGSLSTGERRRQQSDEGDSDDACGIAFVGEHSEIVLVSDGVSGTESATRLAGIMMDNGMSTTISNYTHFLESAELITGAILVSTAPCQLVGLSIRVNASIREANTDPLGFDALQELAADQQEILSTYATHVLLPPDAFTPSPTSGSDGGEASVGLIAGVVTAGVVTLLVAMVMAMMGVLYCRVKHKKSRHRVTLEVPNRQFHLKSSSQNLMSPVNTGIDQMYGKSPPPQGHNLQAQGSTAVLSGPGTSDLIPPRPPSPVTSGYLRNLSPHMLIHSTEIRLLDCIGQGGFGVVYKAHLLKTPQMAMQGNVDPQIVAVKTLKYCYDRAAIHSALDECVKMKGFDHPNVLRLLGVCVDAGPSPYMVIPYMANGSLLAFLKKERESLLLPMDADEEMILEAQKRLLNMCSQISRGMEYLAMKKFVHRDLAARNCMIDSQYVIKVSDFGLSEDVYARNYFRQDTVVKLPVKWMAPESLTDGLFTEKTDVWSFGVTCWEVFSVGKIPYPGVDPSSLVKMLVHRGERLEKPENSACTDTMYGVMRKCWYEKAEDRPTFSKLVSEIEGLLTSLAGYLELEQVTGILCKSTEEELHKSRSVHSTEFSPSLGVNT